MVTVCTECYEMHKYPRFYDVRPQATCDGCGRSCLGYVVDVLDMGAAPPTPVYLADIETLREMLADQRVMLAAIEEGVAEFRKRWGDTPLNASTLQRQAWVQRRIEALTTAIEVMGGAL